MNLKNTDSHVVDSDWASPSHVQLALLLLVTLLGIYLSYLLALPFLPSLPVFISVVGGMLVFGACGILLGPVVLTITQVLLELNVGKARVDLDGA